MGQVILSLPHSLAQTGMVAGIIILLLFASLAMWTVYLMVVLYLDNKNRKIKAGTWCETQHDACCTPHCTCRPPAGGARMSRPPISAERLLLRPTGTTTETSARSRRSTTRQVEAAGRSDAGSTAGRRRTLPSAATRCLHRPAHAPASPCTHCAACQVMENATYCWVGIFSRIVVIIALGGLAVAQIIASSSNFHRMIPALSKRCAGVENLHCH